MTMLIPVDLPILEVVVEPSNPHPEEVKVWLYETSIGATIKVGSFVRVEFLASEFQFLPLYKVTSVVKAMGCSAMIEVTATRSYEKWRKYDGGI